MSQIILETINGSVEIDDEQAISFPEGIYGFENEKSFFLLDMNEDHIFQILQSKENKNLAFILINPYLFKRDYILNVQQTELLKVGISSLEEAVSSLGVFSIVTLGQDGVITGNLCGPILINFDKKIGLQALNLENSYTTKYKILEHLEQTVLQEQKVS